MRGKIITILILGILGGVGTGRPINIPIRRPVSIAMYRSVSIPLHGPVNPSGSLIISEILFDPDPVVGLPSYEFVEWYNAGGDTVDLAGWQWVAGDKVRRLAGGSIPPRGFLIVCSPAAMPAFSRYGQVIAMESFPVLRNTGDRLTLISPAGTAVHTVNYSPVQHSDVLRAGGGWSLELADLAQPCNPLAWLTSEDPSGGTPGGVNSRQVALPVPEPPLLIRAAGYAGGHFVLLFSGYLDPLNDMNNYACMLMPGAIQAPAVQAAEYGFPGLFFQVPADLDPVVTYTIELSGTIRDCSGRDARLRTVLLGLAPDPDSAAVVITEILFEPKAGQPEFVELYNRSDRVIELKDLILARAGTDGVIRSFSNGQDLSYWLFPGCYAVLTADQQLFARSWPLTDPALVAGRSDMPALTDEESLLTVMDKAQKILDVAAYSPDWHYPYLEEDKGVSLERIDINARGTDRSNWFSASAALGGSTPGTKNTNALEGLKPASQQFWLDPVIAYPMTSADPVRVAIHFTFDTPGWFMKVTIFSSAGQPIRELFSFGLAPVAGFVCWDGLDAGQRLVPDGIYVAVVEYYHPSGKKGRWKRGCARVGTY